MMGPAEFLGGKYQKPEQIKPGPVQTFRAKEVSTGRTVFAHRVSTTEEPAEQASLLRLLMSALFRSPRARSLVLDFGDDQGFWYVITQGEPQCLQLREWLQFEIDQADGSPAPAQTKAKTEPDPDRTQLATPKVGILTPEGPAREPGEFTRMFQTGGKPPSSKPEAPTWAEPAKPVEPKPAEVKQGPGEFTRMFLSKAEAANPPDNANTAPAKPDKAPAEDGPGEFTRFFSQGGLPASKNAPEPMASQDRFPTREVQRPSGGVQRAQRPSSPLPQRPSSEPGEFTRLFSRAPEGAAAPEPRASNLDDMFERAPAMPSAPTPSAPEPGEYTRIFGKSDLGPSPQQPSTVAPPAQGSILHDPIAPASSFPSGSDTTKQVPKPATAPAPAAHAPSEYTAVLRGFGSSGASAPAGEQAAPGGAAPAASNVKLPPAPAISGIQPKMPAATAPKPPAGGRAMPQVKPPQAAAAGGALAAKAAPAASNKKLIIFFCVLGVLTIVLIVLIALIALKK